ncbi:hypothetical protein [Streptomyces sp. NRRL WC-3742]|uniref:hypothetical protein n=1 Tax=Streptomyces sp. NRRL WC-3742 TaxID=1463934 RepID=UPI0004CA8C4C|nr:hypothetical protein [Streptomyces sp. NRRL WC-3742]
MTAPTPGADDQSARPLTAQHYTVAALPPSPEGYAAPGMPGAPVPTQEADSPTRHRATPRHRPTTAILTALLAALLGGLAYGFAPLRAADTLGWLAIALAGLVALPLGRLGGPSRAFPPLGALLAAAALLLGQLTQHLRQVHADGPGPAGLLHDTLTTWRADLRPLDLAFYAIALIGGHLLTHRAAARS